MAHLLCELFLRHKAVGLVTDHSFEFPITQSELADAGALNGARQPHPAGAAGERADQANGVVC